MEDSGRTEPDQAIIEVVKMLDNGTLEICHGVTMRNGPRPAITGWTSEPGDPDFVEFATRHGVTKPGQVSTIRKD
jgi:hypothetical protein